VTSRDRRTTAAPVDPRRPRVARAGVRARRGRRIRTLVDGERVPGGVHLLEDARPGS